MNQASVTYLDHAASTGLRPEALEAMMPFLVGEHGNPSGAHRVARRARTALEEARDTVADVVGCSPHDVVFTSGGTEADNLAINGSVAQGGVAVCAATEHHAVLDPVEHTGGRVVGVTAAGHIDLEALSAALDDTVAVVSAMAVNNETGVIADLATVAELVGERAPTAALHTDAVQASNWLDLGEVWSNVDMMSLAGHKFGGPKGAGTLIVAPDVRLDAQLRGGGQEHERRSGTQNVAAIVGFATALRVAQADRAAEVERINGLSERIVTLAHSVPGVTCTVEPASRVPGICHLTTGVNSEELLLLLDREGIMASAASSCASGAMQPSHVLTAMGRSDLEASGALRLSMSHASTSDDVDHLCEVLPGLIVRLHG